jgi:hypothetical protein
MNDPLNAVGCHYCSYYVGCHCQTAASNDFFSLDENEL